MGWLGNFIKLIVAVIQNLTAKMGIQAGVAGVAWGGGGGALIHCPDAP